MQAKSSNSTNHDDTLNPRWMRNWAILGHHLLGIVFKGHRPWGVTRIVLLLIFWAVLVQQRWNHCLVLWVTRRGFGNNGKICMVMYLDSSREISFFTRLLPQSWSEDDQRRPFKCTSALYFSRQFLE